MNPDVANTFVLLHGFTGRGASWQTFRQEVAALHPEVEILAPDLPGHQGLAPLSHGPDAQKLSPKTTLPSSFQAAVDQIVVSLDLKSPAHVVGYSLGGRLALGLALRHPDLVSTLTLIGARPGLDSAARHQRMVTDDALALRLEQEGLKAFLTSWQQLPLFASQAELPQPVLARQRELREGHCPQSLAWALRTLSPGRMPDYRPRLAELEMPVRLVVGELDRDFRALAESMLPALSRGELKVISGCGHNVLLEAPARLACLILKPIQ